MDDRTILSDEEQARVWAVFRRQRIVFGSVFVSALLTLLGAILLWESGHAPRGLRDNGHIFFLALYFLFALFVTMYWRCPACEGGLWGLTSPRYCPNCAAGLWKPVPESRVDRPKA